MWMETRRHLGVRGATMLLCCYLWALVGVATWIAGNNVPLLTYVPQHARAVCWWLSAAVAVASCWSRRWSAWGLAVLLVLPALRTLAYLWAWIVWLTPGELHGEQYGWFGSCFYVAFVGLVIVAAYTRQGGADELD